MTLVRSSPSSKRPGTKKIGLLAPFFPSLPSVKGEKNSNKLKTKRVRVSHIFLCTSNLNSFCKNGYVLENARWEISSPTVRTTRNGQESFPSRYEDSKTLKVTGCFSHDLLHLIMTENDILGHSHLSWPLSLPNYKESESKNLIGLFYKYYLTFIQIGN